MHQPAPNKRPVEKWSRDEARAKVQLGAITQAPREEPALLPLEERIRSFKEIVLRFTRGRSVEEINAALRKRKIFGGHALEKDFPSLENCALYCVTEIHSQADIDRLAAAVKKVVA